MSAIVLHLMSSESLLLLMETSQTPARAENTATTPAATQPRIAFFDEVYYTILHHLPRPLACRLLARFRSPVEQAMATAADQPPQLMKIAKNLIKNWKTKEASVDSNVLACQSSNSPT